MYKPAFFFALSLMAAAACARSADEPDDDAGTVVPGPDTGVALDAGSDSTAFDAKVLDVGPHPDVVFVDVNLDGPPPPPPPPPDGGDPAICNQFDPVGNVYYTWEYFRRSDAPACPCDAGSQCCYTFFLPPLGIPVDQVCLNRGY